MFKYEVVGALSSIQEIIERLGAIAKEYGLGWEEWDEIVWDELNMHSPDEATITLRWDEYNCGCCEPEIKEFQIPINLLWDDDYIAKIKQDQDLKRRAQLERVRRARVKKAEEKLELARKRAATAQEEANREVARASAELSKLIGDE